MLRELLQSIMNIIFGHRTVDNAKDWHAARTKAQASRDEVEQIIAESERNQ
jgi:hypothetical protein